MAEMVTCLPRSLCVASHPAIRSADHSTVTIVNGEELCESLRGGICRDTHSERVRQEDVIYPPSSLGSASVLIYLEASFVLFSCVCFYGDFCLWE